VGIDALINRREAVLGNWSPQGFLPSTGEHVPGKAGGKAGDVRVYGGGIGENPRTKGGHRGPSKLRVANRGTGASRKVRQESKSYRRDKRCNGERGAHTSEASKGGSKGRNPALGKKKNR